MKNLALLLFSLLLAFNAHTQDILGCTDPQANNYNEFATINDGSCTYNPTIYNPSFRFLLPQEVEETSGLILFNDGYWTHNDSGGQPIIYKLDTLTGEVIQRIRLSGRTNIDWEDIAQDETKIYVGDFGNNNGNRDNLAIYIIEKTDIPMEGDTEVSSQKISFVYEDYIIAPIKKRNNNFDCEAMIAVEGSIYLFSKNRGDNQSKLYKLPITEGDYTAQLLTTFNSAGLVTGADYNEISNELILIGYTNNSWNPFFWLMFDFEGLDFFSGNKRRIDMISIPATQTEGICYTHGSKGVISSESNPLFTQTMFNFNTSQWTFNESSTINEIEDGTFDFKITPNPVTKKKLNLYFERMPANNYDIAVFDSMGRMVATGSYNIKRHEEGVKIKIKLNNANSGVYFVRVSSENGMLEKKFIKQ